MARSNRTVVADGWYHITARAYARQGVFMHGTIFTHDPVFEKTLRASLPKRFPAGGSWAQERHSRFD